MIFKNELPLNHEPSLNDYAQKTADDMCEIVNTHATESLFACWDYEYELAWKNIEHDRELEGLEWRTNDGVWA